MNHLKNVAIIMDGNGRWANARFKPRFWGHVRGAKVVHQIVEKAVDLELQSLTLYAFSTENWSRPANEVQILIKLLDKFIDNEAEKILSHNIRFKVIGDLDSLDPHLRAKVERLENESSLHDGLLLVFAFGYGARSEIVKTTQKIIDSGVQKVDEKTFSQTLFCPEISEIDLVIRTGGDQRISNFLLWQIAYAELFFTPTLWPDFSAEEFNVILSKVNKRERRFGGVKSYPTQFDQLSDDFFHP